MKFSPKICPMALVCSFLILFCSCTHDSDLFNDLILQDSLNDKDIESYDKSDAGNQDMSNEDSESDILNDNTNVNYNDNNLTGDLAQLSDFYELPGDLKAFPDAEGFGQYATGGRQGRVIEVTNLNDHGEGSLRSAIDASGSRTIVFKVSGTINLTSPIHLKNGDITIAGQTAPGKGITLKSDGSFNNQLFQINTSNVIIRYIRFRRGLGVPGECCGDSVVFSSGADKVILDHCSISWGTDENISGTNASNITIQNSIISEGLFRASHTYTMNDPEIGHSKGSLFDGSSRNISIFRNLFAHNDGRNPRISADEGPFEIVNNLMYNNEHFNIELDPSRSSSDLKVNIIGNLFKEGPNTMTERKEIHLDSDKSIQLYIKGNLGWNNPNTSLNEKLMIGQRSNLFTNTTFLLNRPFNTPLNSSSAVIDAENLEQKILNDVGASIHRDEVDNRIIKDFISGTGTIIDNPQQVGGWPDLGGGNGYEDSDKDGMEDNWELRNGLNPSDPNDGSAIISNNGYTNLDVFLHLLTELDRN